MPKTNPTTDKILKEIEALHAFQAQLAQVTGTNTKVFSDAFTMVDAQLHVMQRVLNDIYLETVAQEQGRVYRSDAGIDFSCYMGEYAAMIGLSAFLAQLKETIPAEEVPDNVIVFGG